MQVKMLKYLSFALILFVVACTKTETETTVQPTPQPYLVSATFVKEFTKPELITALGQAGQQFAPFVKNGVRQYKIVYNTTNTDGTKIQASGALIVPTGLTDAPALVSYQHGTIFNDKDAPSYLTTTSSEGQIATLLASFGFITSAPDYIGYGTSNNLPHTYEHREGLATASLDMLRAAKETIANEKINWNKSLYLAGYSEGGYATMSLQKKIEETTGTEFNLKAASSGAGAYNKTQSFKNLVTTRSSGDSTHNASYIWVLLTYDRIYKFNRPLNTYFIEPYATQIQTQKQNARIGGSFDGLLTTAIKKGITDGTDTALLTAVADNDIFDWKPKTPTRLYHGDKDTYVPYFNSVTAADAMKKRGADVELVTVAGGNHGSSISSFFLGTLEFFNLKK
jgi:pimeloyl-ACP methyl ester carboxylesterase